MKVSNNHNFKFLIMLLLTTNIYADVFDNNLRYQCYFITKNDRQNNQAMNLYLHGLVNGIDSMIPHQKRKRCSDCLTYQDIIATACKKTIIMNIELGKFEASFVETAKSIMIK